MGNTQPQQTTATNDQRATITKQDSYNENPQTTINTQTTLTNNQQGTHNKQQRTNNTKKSAPHTTHITQRDNTQRTTNN